MLKLNKMTDYAIVCLGILSKKPNTFVTAHEISQESGISLTAIQKILKLLAKKSNVLSTLQGSLGGYKLAVSPSSISITSVIEMIDGPIKLTSCVEGADQKCECSNICLLEGNWNKVNKIIVETLSNISVADLLAPDKLINFKKNKNYLQNEF